MEAQQIDFRAIVDKKFSNELDVFAFGRGKSRTHASISQLTDHVSVSYKGRTLVELIQNAYDPHPATRSDGEISILFDPTEGPHGCLYVANRGEGFTQENFQGLCNIADSSKVVNEGIGNKGLGFRSVAQICKHPEVYSSYPISPSSGTLNGFCFTFPTDEHLRSLLQATRHCSYLDEVLATMPRTLLPVFVEDRPGHVQEFAAQGFATVIRMPLERAEATTDVRTQIDDLCDHELPIHLFLDRISQIRIEVRGQDNLGDEDPFCRVLPRQTQDSWQQDGIYFNIVRVDDGAEYLVSRYRLPDEVFRPVLEAGIFSEQLPEAWRIWGDPPEISVAIGLGSAGRVGRLYNFLPMASVAESPCACHINAPFYSDIDRKDLVENVKLNDYFLEEIAALCLRTAQDLQKSKPNLAHEAVLDLTMWDGDEAEVMTEVAREHTGISLAELPLIPSCDGSPRHPWSSLEDVFEWPGSELELKTLNPETVASVARIDLLKPSVRGERLKRLIHVAEHTTGHVLRPLPETTADWVEKFATNLQDRGVSIKTWNSFYEDLASLLSDSPEVLQGRKILLTEDNKLVPTLTKTSGDATDSKTSRKRRGLQRAVFLPNTRASQGSVTDGGNIEGEDELDYEDELAARIPKSLERIVRVINRNLACAARNDDTGVRQFLIDNDLVSQFLTEDIQRLLANVTASPGPGKNPDKRRLEALRFAFELSDRGAKTAELGDMPFHVPTLSNQWVRATRAFFGRSWPGTRGKELAELVKAAEHISDELRSVGENMLRDQREWIGLGKADGKAWAHFLKSLGLRDALRLRNVRPPGALQEEGQMFRAKLLERCAVSGDAHKFWQKDLLPAVLPNPYTPWTVRGPVPALPGQSDYQDFTPSAKLLYAREILACIQETGSSPFTIAVFRPQHPYAPNERMWPSPLGSFLSNSKWLPVKSEHQDVHFTRPSGAWHLPPRATSVSPKFLITVTMECRSFLDAHPEVQEILQENCGLKIVNSADSCAAQLQLLGEIASNGQVPSGSLSAFDSLYSEGWRRLAEDLNALEEFLESSPFIIAAHAGTGVVGFKLDTDDVAELEAGSDARIPLAYLADDHSPTTRDLLKELGRPVFDFKFPRRADVCGKIHEKYPRLERVSNVRLDVLLQDGPFQPGEADPLLSPMDRRWLQDTILVVVDLAAGGFLNLGPEALERLRARISRLRYRLVEDIHLQIDGDTVPLPEFAQGCLLVNDKDWPTLLIRTPEQELSWGILQQASHALAEGLGYPVHLSSVLSSAFGQLSQRHGAYSLGKPSELDLQAVCRKGGQAVHESLRNLRQALDSRFKMLDVAIFALTERNAVDQFHLLAEKIESEVELLEALRTLSADWPLDTDSLLAACMQNDDLNGLRRELAIDLTRFNEAIRELGPPHREISFAQEHAQQFRAFVTTHRDEIQQALRVAFRSAYDDGHSLSAYVTASKLYGLNTATGWATQYEELPQPVMLTRVNEWLATFEAEPLQEVESPPSPTVSQCRTANRDALRKVVSEGWAVLNAWCREKNHTVPERWRTRDQAPQSLVTHVQGDGWLDFDLLDTSGLIRALAVSGNWPDGMPATLDPCELNIDKTALSTAEEEARQMKAERARLASIVNVGDIEVSADQEDLPDILNTLISDYEGSGPGLDTPAKIVNLEALKQPSKGLSGRGGKKSRGSAPPRDLPEAKKKIIGLLGERFAFEWLRRQYPSAITEESWVSTNRERALQFPGGDDSLGYDFVVNLPSYTLYFEVKATSGEDFFFRLGPTEVEAAVQCRSDSKHRYRVLLVQNVLSPEATRPLLLPNPYSNQYRDRFQLVSKGEQGFRFLPSG